jgi:hypothetical protein
VELHQLEVGQGGAGAARQQEADPQRSGRVRRAAPERRAAAGREHDRAGPHDTAVLADDADAAALVRPQAAGARALEDRHPAQADHEGGEVANHAAARRTASGVRDAAA